MGCLYSMYSVEDRKILSILKRYEQPKKSCFLKIKEALGYRNDNILTADGDRKLTMQKLICLNDILNDGFYTKINRYSFYQPTWYRDENIKVPENSNLQDCIELFNIRCISEDRFLSEIKQYLLSACGLTAAILFFE